MANRDYRRCLHFVGVIPRQRWKAIKIWGRPDFEHERATWSILGEIDGDDTVIFGAGAFFVPRKWKAHTRLLLPHEIGVADGAPANPA